MSTDESDVYQIGLPASLEDELADALKEAAAENGAAGHYTLTKEDAEKAASELNFDLFTVAAGIYVGNLIISGVSSYFIRCALDRVANLQGYFTQIFRDKLHGDGLGAASTAAKGYPGFELSQKKRGKIAMTVTTMSGNRA